MPIPGNLLTTAMAVMPHTDVDQALQTALSLDIPFWPQLPNVSYREDMYVQAAEHFPGVELDLDRRSLRFSIDRFAIELEPMLARFEDPGFFDISPDFSVVYHRFLTLDLRNRPAIRGQLEGPVSFGFNVLDQDDRPILFDDTVRPFLMDFMARRVNVQLHRLKALNPDAFMFIDEPGLQFLFSAMSGYDGTRAKADLDGFLQQIDRPRGIHLCGNPDWDFLLGLDMDVVSLDIFTNAEIFSACGRSLQRFLSRGGVIVWGIVPTNAEPFGEASVPSLARRLETVWSAIEKGGGIDRAYLLSRSLLSPATCCLVNPDKEKTVEAAFDTLSQLSLQLREKYDLS